MNKIFQQINWFLVVLLLVLIALFTFNWQYGKATVIFYGFAENKERNFSFEHPVNIIEILATEGAKVKKGDLLMRVQRSDLALEKTDINNQMELLGAENTTREGTIRATIAKLKAEIIALKSERGTQILTLQAELDVNKNLLRDIKSLDKPESKQILGPTEVKIEGLRRDLQAALQPLHAEINKLEGEIALMKQPLDIQLKQFGTELEYIDDEEGKLAVYAANDGIIGSLLCKVGENIAPFTTVATLYDPTPSQVMGYVQEKLLVHVKIGDMVQLSTESGRGQSCEGQVLGLGTRIVEIPERLRKIPEYKIYGREVVIRVPQENAFLQNEKVLVSLEKKQSKNIIKLFSTPVLTSFFGQ